MTRPPAPQRRVLGLAVAVVVAVLALCVAVFGVRTYLGDMYAANGARALQSGDLRVAVWSYEKALGYIPASYTSRVQLGIARRGQLDLEGALVEFRDAVAIAPHCVPCLLELAGALIPAGELDEAERTIERIRALVPNHWKAAYLRGLYATQRADADAALAAFHESLSLPGVERETVLVAAAEAALRLGEIYEALNYAEKALGTGFHDPALHVVRGKIFEALGEGEEAIRSYERVLGIVRERPAATPRDVAAGREVLPRLFALHVSMGRWPDAVTDLTLMAQTGTAPGELVTLGVSLLEGWPEGASTPEDGHALMRLGLLLGESGARPAAESALRSAMPLLSATDAAFGQYRLAQVLMADGRREEALALLTEAQAAAPERPEIGLVRARLLVELGRNDEARLEYQRLRALPGLSDADRGTVESALGELGPGR